MDRNQQKEFVDNLCESIRKDVVAKIESGAVPETWDGIELREYLADEFDKERWMKRNKQTRRLRDYRNEVATKFGL